ncbi:MAG: hypothetical protein EA397_09960 [Deltaproteobacteria bacterium]|nr:MAG: hypothetical protein EA397_09960 [Deltaproteobacteria bacterium]
MKLYVPLTATVLVGLGLACSGVGGAAMGEPWVGLGIPSDGGNVIYSDESTVTIQFTSDRTAELAQQVKESLESSECSDVKVFEGGGSHSVMCDLGDQKVTVSVSTVMGKSIISAASR